MLDSVSACGIPVRFARFVALLASCLISAWAHAQGSNITLTTPPALTMHQLSSVESTRVIKPWKRHWKLTEDTIVMSGNTMRFVQTRVTPAMGFGLPGRLEWVMALPMGVTIEPAVSSGKIGFGLGDLRLGLLYQLKAAPRGGLGMLAGVIGAVPTGQNQRLLGEGDFSALGFVAFSITSFSSSLTVNVGYQLRPSHTVVLLDGKSFEQDDDLIWRAALRIPKDEDVAWSLVANGTIGVATSDGFWPKSNNRPLWLGGGIDYPTWSENRLGLFVSFRANGPDRGMLLSLQLSGIAKDNDEDHDGVVRRYDQCPVLREDMDGFEDEDGCPDHDNDQDGFPDPEDACPLTPGDDFSEDGC